MSNKRFKWRVVVVLIGISIVLVGCANQTKSVSKSSQRETQQSTVEKKNQTNSISILTSKLKQENEQIEVDVQVKNTSQSAEPVKSNSFVLILDNQALSPNLKTSIPEQIPAETTIDITLQFDNKKFDGSKKAKLGFQPNNPKQAQIFYNIGTVVFKKAVAPSTKPTKKNTLVSQTVKTKESSSATNKNQINLQYQNLGGGFSVDVPINWTRSSYGGEDFGGYQYTNPKDPNQKMLAVGSACAGCVYSDPNLTKLDPASAIPETDIQSKFIYGNGYNVGYSFYQTGDPYLGNGVLKATTNDGYGYVEIILPNSDKSVSTEILNSFSFHPPGS